MTWTGAPTAAPPPIWAARGWTGWPCAIWKCCTRSAPGIDSGAHFGSRIAFADGHVFAGFGDRGFKNFGPDHIAQDLEQRERAVIRLTLEGDIPADNPFTDQPGAAGRDLVLRPPQHSGHGRASRHRRACGLAEHGEAGGDEVNIVERGGNYGWPLASHAVTYRDGDEFAPPHQPGDGFVAPVFHWPAGRDNHNPPSGMAFYDRRCLSRLARPFADRQPAAPLSWAL